MCEEKRERVSGGCVCATWSGGGGAPSEVVLGRKTQVVQRHDHRTKLFLPKMLFSLFINFKKSIKFVAY